MAHKHIAYQCEACDYYVYSSDWAVVPVIYCGKCTLSICKECLSNEYDTICKQCTEKWKRKEKLELTVNYSEGEKINRLCREGYLVMGEATEIKDPNKRLSEVDVDDVEFYAILIHQGKFSGS